LEVVKRVDSIQNSPSSPQLVLIIHTIMTRPIQKQHGDILIKKCNIAPQRSHNGERQLSHCNNSYCNHGYILVGPNKAPHISTQCYPTQYRPNTTKTEQSRLIYIILETNPILCWSLRHSHWEFHWDGGVRLQIAIKEWLLENITWCLVCCLDNYIVDIWQGWGEVFGWVVLLTSTFP